MAKANPFRFSTKYQDDETDLLYYGYRFYNGSTGRWLSRDPIGEKGGRNLYAFCRNGGPTKVDPLGKIGFGFGGSGTFTIISPLPTVGGASLGISIAWTEQIYIVSRRPFCRWCTQMSLTTWAGVGGGITAAVGPSFTWTWSEPEEGYSLSLGFGAGNVEMWGMEFSVDVDINKGDINVTVPKWGAGFAWYGGLRVTGTCTGCSWNPKVRWARALACVQNVVGNIAATLASADGTIVPMSEFGAGDLTREFHHGSSFSLDSAPE